MKPAHAVVAAVVGAVAAIGASVVATAIVMALMHGGGGLSQQRIATSFPVVATTLGVTSMTLLLTALLAPALAGRSVRRALGLHAAPVLSFVAGTIGVLALGPVSDLLMQWMARLAPDFTLGGLQSLQRIADTHPPWLLFPILAVLPGVSEELLFRGMLQRAFGRGVRAIMVSGLAFAAFHVDPHHIAGVLPLGFYMAWLADRTGSTWVTMLAHILNNTAALLAPNVEALDKGYGTDTPVPPWWAAAGLAVALLAAVLVHYSTRKRTSSAPEAR